MPDSTSFVQEKLVGLFVEGQGDLFLFVFCDFVITHNKDNNIHCTNKIYNGKELYEYVVYHST